MGYEENQENGNHNIEVKPVLCRKKSMSGGANILVWRGGDTTRRRRYGLKRVTDWQQVCFTITRRKESD